MRLFNKTSLLCCSLLLLSSKLVSAQEWFPVEGGIQSGVSGMAFIEDPPIKANPMLKKRGVLIVHDNRSYKPSVPGTKTEQEFEKDTGKRNNRLAIVRFENNGNISYRPLEWPDPQEAPNGLEAISSIPGEKNAYVALTSKGQGYYLKL